MVSYRLDRKNFTRKKRNFKHDPIVVLAYIVLTGVLLSGFTSFSF